MKTDRKKRLLSIIMVLCMIFILLLTSSKRAQAIEGPTSYGLFVGDTWVTSANKDNITGGGIEGFIRYNPESKILTVSGAAIRLAGGNGGSFNSILSTSDITINLVGDNTLSNINTSTIGGYGIKCAGTLEITGQGSLEVNVANKRNSYGLYATNRLILNGTVSVSSEGTDTATGLYGNSMEISGETVNVTATAGNAYAIQTISDVGVNITGGKLTAISSGGTGVAVDGSFTYPSGKAIVSENSDGSGAFLYLGAGTRTDISTYKYLRVENFPIVATIGGTGYASLQNAVSEVLEGQIIQLQSDITLLNDINIVNGDARSFSIDLNGKTLNRSLGVVISHRGSGTLTIIDSSGSTGKITSDNPGDTIHLYGGSSLDVAGGMIENSYSAYANVIYNEGNGNISVTGGTVQGGYNDAIRNYSNGDVNITGGRVEGRAAIINNSTGRVTISGGIVSGTVSNAILNGSTGKITISGTATVTSAEVQGTIKLNNGTTPNIILEITGGTVINTNEGYAIINNGPGIISIPSGTAIIKGGYRAMNKAPDLSSYNNVKITGSISSVEGTSATEITKADIDTDPKVQSYKYLKFEPTTVTLQSIIITAPPTKTTYIYGESFRTEGMVVKATYSNGNENANFTDYSVDKTDALTMSDTTVTLTADNTSIRTTQNIIINKADGPAVTGVSAVGCTNSNNNDGKLTGVTSAMQYKNNNASDYISGNADGSDISGLTNGTYLVRVKSTNTHNAGTVSTFIVGAYVPPAPGNGNSGNNNTTTPTKKEGRIEKDQKQDEKAPAASLNNSTEELKSKLLNAEEQAKVLAGKDAKVILKIEDISASVSDEDKKQVEEKLAKEKQGGTDTAFLYIDISLYKKIGDEAETKVTNTIGKISISIEVPENMRSTEAGTGRTYRVIRVHNGVAEVLEGTYDPATHLFTFETDRFSTYALTYQDESTIPDPNNAGTTDQLMVSKDFNKLRLTAKASKTSQKLIYAKVDEADGYIIYGAKCGQELKELADVAAAVTEYTVKKLKQATYYKYQVKAYQLIDGERVIFATSKVVHSVTEGKTYANPTKVTMDVKSVVFSVGESKTVTAKVSLPKGMKMREHTALIRYESTNKEIATVSSKGKIKAKAQGTCYVYAYAQNGVYKKIKITVE